MKVVEVPATTKTVLDRVVCDFCGATIPKRGSDFHDVTIECDSGCIIPEGGWGVKTQFDCCEKCWNEKVKPTLCALGADPRVTEYDM
jgi:hypothetical protein